MKCPHSVETSIMIFCSSQLTTQLDHLVPQLALAVSPLVKMLMLVRHCLWLLEPL